MLPDIFTLLLLASQASATPPALTMDDAVRLALQGNPRIAALRQDIAASRHNLSSSGAPANPLVMFTPGLTREGSDEELLIQQPLEVNGTRRARRSIARAEQSAVIAESLAEFRDLVFAVKAQFVAVASAEESLALAKTLAEHAKEMDRLAGRQVELGVRPGIDKTQTRMEVTRANISVESATARLETAKASLAVLLGAQDRIIRVATPAFSPPSLGTQEELTELALKQRSEVALADARKQALDAQSDLVRAEGLPDLTPQFRMSSVTREPRVGGFGVSVSLPLVDYGSRRERLKQLQATAKAEELRAEAARALVRAEVAEAYIRLSTAAKVVASYEGLLADAQRLLDATLKGFELGSTTVLEALDARRSYRSARADSIAALAEYELAKATLERAIGSIPGDWLNAPNDGRPDHER